MSSASNSSHGQGGTHPWAPLAHCNVHPHLAASISLAFSNPHLWTYRQIRILKGGLCPPPPSRTSLWRGWCEHPLYITGSGGGHCMLGGILLLITQSEGQGEEYFPLHRLPSPTRQPRRPSVSATQHEETLSGSARAILSRGL